MNKEQKFDPDQQLLGLNTSSKRSASLADSASETIAGGGGPINSSVSSSNSASLKIVVWKYHTVSSDVNWLNWVRKYNQ